MKKPVIVSMGSVAASGGYYVSMAGDTIFADAATITASIGVLGGKFATTDMWNHLGITWDSNRRGANAGLFSSEAPFSEAERKKVQTWMNEVYGTFKGHVVAARGPKLQKPIDQLAGRPRVYRPAGPGIGPGRQDRHPGGRDPGRRQTGPRSTDYEVRTYPEPRNFLELLVEDLSDGERDPNHLSLPARGLGASGGTSLLEPGPAAPQRAGPRPAGD